MKKSKHPPLEPLFLTEEKIAELKAEAKRLEKEVMPEARGRLARAYEDGDIPENNPFITAHEDLQVAMKQLNTLRDLIYRSKLYKPHKEKKKGYIHLGSTFTLKRKNGITQTFTLVSSIEADPEHNKLSIDSPIGKVIAGKKVGDIVQITTPNESYSVEIV